MLEHRSACSLVFKTSPCNVVSTATVHITGKDTGMILWTTVCCSIVEMPGVRPSCRKACCAHWLCCAKTMEVPA